MIGNAHIDPVWLWQWPEGYQEVRATFRSALDRMHEYPEFIFTANSAAYYAWVKEIDPAMFEEIRERVGRGPLAGASAAGGSSQTATSRRASRSCATPCTRSAGSRRSSGSWPRLGTTSIRSGTTGCCPSCCAARAWTRTCSCAPARTRSGCRARSSGGSRLTGRASSRCACRTSTARRGRTSGYHLDKSLAQLPDRFAEMMVFYGVGNHGGGPTRENLELIRALDASRSMPHLLHSTPDRFFAQVRERGTDDIPVVRDDLQHHAVGCYSAHSGIKRWNRRAEQQLAAAEAWSAVTSWVTGEAYPRAAFAEAWKAVLFNQFHDILAGTAIEPAYEEARDQLGEASAIATRAHNVGIQSLSSRIGIAAEPGTTPIVVFNPARVAGAHDCRDRVRRAQGDRRPGRRRRAAGAVPGDPVVRDRVRVAEPAGDRRGPAAARVPDVPGGAGPAARDRGRRPDDTDQPRERAPAPRGRSGDGPDHAPPAAARGPRRPGHRPRGPGPAARGRRR